VTAFERPTPIWGVMQYQWVGQSMTEVAPQHCPEGHPLGPGTVTVSWSISRRLRQYTCEACYHIDPDSASWCPAPDSVVP
jgi:hypothetical protein